MKPTDFESFRELIVGTAGAFGSYMPSETIALYFSDLKAFELGEVKEALAEFRNDASQKQMPTPGMVKFLIYSKRKKPFELEVPQSTTPPEGFFKEVYEKINYIPEKNKLPYDKLKALSNGDEEEIKQPKEIPDIQPLNEAEWERLTGAKNV